MSRRSDLEPRIGGPCLPIALLNNLGRDPIDRPSAGWMDHWADHRAVRESGLWNVKHEDEPYAADFLRLFERYVGDSG